MVTTFVIKPQAFMQPIISLIARMATSREANSNFLIVPPSLEFRPMVLYFEACLGDIVPASSEKNRGILRSHQNGRMFSSCVCSRFKRWRKPLMYSSSGSRCCWCISSNARKTSMRCFFSVTRSACSNSNRARAFHQDHRRMSDSGEPPAKIRVLVLDQTAVGESEFGNTERLRSEVKRDEAR